MYILASFEAAINKYRVIAVGCVEDLAKVSGTAASPAPVMLVAIVLVVAAAAGACARGAVLRDYSVAWTTIDASGY